MEVGGCSGGSLFHRGVLRKWHRAVGLSDKFCVEAWAPIRGQALAIRMRLSRAEARPRILTRGLEKLGGHGRTDAPGRPHAAFSGVFISLRAKKTRRFPVFSGVFRRFPRLRKRLRPRTFSGVFRRFPATSGAVQGFRRFRRFPAFSGDFRRWPAIAALSGAVQRFPAISAIWGDFRASDFRRCPVISCNFRTSDFR